jgi:hypothetical protein
MTNEEVEKLLKSHVQRLSEHFENVQIFVARMHEGRTQAFEEGSGNYWARKGQVADWVDNIESYEPHPTIEEQIEEVDGDDGDEWKKETA